MSAIKKIGIALSVSTLSIVMFGCSGQNNSTSGINTSKPISKTQTSSNQNKLTPISSLKIADSSLNHCIKSTGRLYIEEISSLTCNNKGIKNLKGIEQLAKLNSLFLNFNEIEDLTPLTDLYDLNTLYLASNKIHDLSPLSGLKNLQMLAVQKNEIYDISPLKNLNNLHSLYTRNNSIHDFSPIEKIEFKNLDGKQEQKS